MNSSRQSLHIPRSYGRWSIPELPGNSVWFPDLDSIPLGSNDPYRPYSFRQLIMLNFRKSLNLPGASFLKKIFLKSNLFMLAQGSIGIRFSDNEPDFSPFSIASVRIKQYLTNRYGEEGTMSNADKLLAQRAGVGENLVRQWINDNQYVWHERQDGRNIDLLCHDIHGNVKHSGGISLNKKRIKPDFRIKLLTY